MKDPTMVTKRAIESYKRFVRIRHQLETEERFLEDLVKEIPEEDMAIYRQETIAIDMTQEDD